MNNIYLDIGTEAFKIYSKDKKLIKYFQENNFYNKETFFQEELKEFKKDNVFLTSSLINSKIENFSLVRKNSNKKISSIENKAIFKKINQEFLLKDCSFFSLKILEIKIDGYKVDNILNYNGQKIEMKILVNFSEKLDFFQEMFKSLKIYSLAELLPVLEGDYYIIDIGGELTHVFEFDQGILVNISEVKKGGKFFSNILTNQLALSPRDARILKERYSNQRLTKPSEEKIKNFFKKEEKDFQKEFEIFNKPRYLLGGGSLLPEVNLFFKGGYLWQLKKAKDMVEKSIEPQHFNCFLMKNYAKKIF